jgi:hypothetical protein
MDHGGGDGGMDHGHGGMEHISEHGVCYSPGQLTTGATVGITAYYNDAVHPQMVHNGRLHNVMGIAIAYIGQ